MQNTTHSKTLYQLLESHLSKAVIDQLLQQVNLPIAFKICSWPTCDPFAFLGLKHNWMKNACRDASHSPGHVCPLVPLVSCHM